MLPDLIRACIDNPLDEAPALVLADWLDESTDPDDVERSVRWGWYWRVLLPALKNLLTPGGKLKDGLGEPETSPHLGSYFPRILLKKLKTPLIPLWATAVLRTIQYQDGTQLIAHSPRDAAQTLAIHELRLLYPQSVLSTTNAQFSSGIDLFDPPELEPLHVTMHVDGKTTYTTCIDLNSRITEIGPFWCIVALPTDSVNPEPFFNAILNCLSRYDVESVLLHEDTGGLRQPNVHALQEIFPVWVVRTFKTFKTTYRTMLKQLRTLEAPYIP